MVDWNSWLQEIEEEPPVVVTGDKKWTFLRNPTGRVDFLYRYMIISKETGRAHFCVPEGAFIVIDLYAVQHQKKIRTWTVTSLNELEPWAKKKWLKYIKWEC